MKIPEKVARAPEAIVSYWGMITDLVQIRRLGEKKHAENSRFGKYLKTREWAEPQLRRAAREIQEKIDCRQCASAAGSRKWSPPGAISSVFPGFWASARPSSSENTP